MTPGSGARTEGLPVVVVGGGPAGLVTALELRRRELPVEVLDRREPPIDKPCGEGLMPDGLERLRRLGVDLSPGTGRPFTGIRYLRGELGAEAEFPGGPGLGLRRTALHEILVRRAEASGARLRWGVAATGLSESGVETEDGVVRARWIVGADGLHSKVRRWAGLEGRSRGRRRFGMRRHFEVAPWTDKVEVHWGERSEAYVTPVSSDAVGVALLWQGGGESFDELMADFPRLRERLAQARSAPTRVQGAGPLEQRVVAPVRGRIALVGDAAGYRDAITGEGLSLAFHQARALAEALAREDPGRYAVAVRRLSRLPYALIRLLLFTERHPRLGRGLVGTLAADPELFGRLLGIHARQLPLGALGPASVARLVLGLAARSRG